LQKETIIPSVEAYAYDAIVILSKAAGECKAKARLSRECVMEYLQENGDALPGQCEKYLIGRGERKAAPYYVYSGCGGNLQPTWEIAGEHEEIYEKWPCKQGSKQILARGSSD
jgi:hypothetical protein